MTRPDLTAAIAAAREHEERKLNALARELEAKDTNPKDAIGTHKLPFSVLPWRAIAGVVHAFLEGGRKYGRHNYRVAGVRASVYFDGMLRHATRWFEGEDYDPEVAGYDRGVRIHHLDKLIASALVIRDAMLAGNWVDDRPPRAREWMREANRQSSLLIDAIPDAVPPYTIADTPPEADGQLDLFGSKDGAE